MIHCGHRYEGGSRSSSGADSESHFPDRLHVHAVQSQTYTCLGNSWRERPTQHAHTSQKQMGRLIKQVYGKARLSWRGNKMLQELKWEIYVGNGTVLRKNRKINCCLAAAEDTDHLARAGRKYPKNSNSASKDLKGTSYCLSYSSQGRAHLPWCAEGKPAEPHWTGTRIYQFIVASGRQTGLSGPGDLGCWNLCWIPHVLQIWNRFLRGKSLILWELYLQDSLLWHLLDLRQLLIILVYWAEFGGVLIHIYFSKQCVLK